MTSDAGDPPTAASRTRTTDAADHVRGIKGPRRLAVVSPAGATSGAIDESAENARMPTDGARVGPGTQLGGKYRLVSELSSGGMGSVFVARNETLDIDVAIKVIRADLLDAPESRLAGRLMQEARAAARLGHPAIVRVQDFGTAPNGDPYLVMELLTGEDLGQALARRGRVKPIKALRSLLPIAHALAAAHEKGIVHRDLKPDNLYLAEKEGQVQPMLIDFGVAKLRKHPSERLTAVGSALGTPEYMSPELARGEDVEHWTDIWSFSVVLYEMMAGRLPFQGKNYHALLRSIIEDDAPRITSFGIDDEALADILERGLAKKPSDRWPTMRQYGLALAGWLLDRGVTDDICGASLEAVWLQARPSGERLDAFATVPPPTANDGPVARIVIERSGGEETPKTGPAAESALAAAAAAATAVLVETADTQPAGRARDRADEEAPSAGGAHEPDSCDELETADAETTEAQIAPARKKPELVWMVALGLVAIAVVTLGVAIGVTIQKSGDEPSTASGATAAPSAASASTDTKATTATTRPAPPPPAATTAETTSTAAAPSARPTAKVRAVPTLKKPEFD